MTGLAAGILSSVIVLAAGAPGRKKAPPKRPPVTPAATAAPSPSSSPSPSPTPTPVPTPSIQDSISFLTEKLATYGKYTFEIAAAENPDDVGRVTGSQSVKRFDAGSCVLTLSRNSELETSEGDDPATEYQDVSRIELRVPLKELRKKVEKKPLPAKYRGVYDVTGGAASLFQLEVFGKEDRKPIAVTDDRRTREAGQSRNERITESVSSTYIIFADDEIATRAKKALEHAIDLCQRKKEAF